MDSIYWALILSFIAGALGYIIVRFWVIPIARYRRSKNILVSRLRAYAGKLPVDALNDKKYSPGKKHFREIRQLSQQLLQLHDFELPYWYRLLLLTRNESPESALSNAAKLENMGTGREIQECLDEIGRHLGAIL